VEKLEHILELARRLPADARRRLIEQLDELDRAEAAVARGPDDRRYEALLALAGTVHSECTDLSTNKYDHIANALAEHKRE
jgi:hypothetical protein